MEAKPIRLIDIVENSDKNTYCFNEKALEKIFLNESVKNRKVVVISIAGAMRKGKD